MAQSSWAPSIDLTWRTQSAYAQHPYIGHIFSYSNPHIFQTSYLVQYSIGSADFFLARRGSFKPDRYTVLYEISVDYFTHTCSTVTPDVLMILGGIRFTGGVCMYFKVIIFDTWSHRYIFYFIIVYMQLEAGELCVWWWPVLVGIDFLALRTSWVKLTTYSGPFRFWVLFLVILSWQSGGGK